MLNIFVVSDATGETAERMVRSALVQFEGAPYNILRRGHIRTAAQVRATVREAAAGSSVLLHTLVSDRLRRLMLAESRAHGVDSMDLMGPVLERLTVHLKLTPHEKPGLFQQLTEARTRVIEAVEFAFAHDDGQNPRELNRAEVVLVGVSRTMKTPTMLFLAYRGWFAANVPIILNVPLPPKLLSMPPDRVFGLYMSPSRLEYLRQARADLFKVPRDPYASPETIREELLLARRLCRDRGWHQMEVTGKSVEEVAQEIILMLSSKRRKRLRK